VRVPVLTFAHWFRDPKGKIKVIGVDLLPRLYAARILDEDPSRIERLFSEDRERAGVTYTASMWVLDPDESSLEFVRVDGGGPRK